jgi:hypothetical protein
MGFTGQASGLLNEFIVIKRFFYLIFPIFPVYGMASRHVRGGNPVLKKDHHSQ